jgi:hypothetical protein
MLFSFMSLFSFGLSAIDPLFLKMAGQWVGEGERVSVGTQRTIRLEARMDSLVGSDSLLLNSRNWIRELTVEGSGIRSGEPKEYVRNLWVRSQAPEQDALPREYRLGYGSGDVDPLAWAQALGNFDGDRFEVRQELGGAPTYVVISTTRFLSEDETDFVERAFHGNEELAVTRIRYRRVTAPPSL